MRSLIFSSLQMDVYFRDKESSEIMIPKIDGNDDELKLLGGEGGGGEGEREGR